MLLSFRSALCRLDHSLSSVLGIKLSRTYAKTSSNAVRLES